MEGPQAAQAVGEPIQRAKQAAERVRETLEATTAASGAEPPRHGRSRGLAPQSKRLKAQRAHRRSVLAFFEWAWEKTKLTVTEAARLIGLSCHTAFHWRSRERHDSFELKLLGRPPKKGSAKQRNQVIGFIAEQGPHVGLPTLQERFPDRARRELQDLQRRYRTHALEGKKLLVNSQTWHQVGAVWAMDFTQLPCAPIDGEFTHVLIVRDLASGYVLEALPARGEDAITCCGVLQALFDRYGPPLVLKSDNGSGFVADAARDLVAENEIVQLYSPPYTPQYNGAVEAGMGPLKTRVHYHAARHGRPGAWTCDDVEAGRRQGNELSRPGGPSGPTPAQAWAARPAISCLQRGAFMAEWRRRRVEARAELGIDVTASLARAEQAEVDRQAIPRALVEHGLLSFERRRISLRKTG